MVLNSYTFMLCFFIFIYIIIFLITYIWNKRKLKKKKYEAIGEMNYLIAKFKLQKKNINYKKEILVISLINSLIIASVGTFVTCLNLPMFVQLLIGFVLLFALIYALYEIYGRHLVKKEKESKK